MAIQVSSAQRNNSDKNECAIIARIKLYKTPTAKALDTNSYRLYYTIFSA